jgi:hypothetical protein
MKPDPEKEEPKSTAPQPGDRVKLIGTHKYSGFQGLYVADAYYLGQLRPKIKVAELGTITFVTDPENQMRKL